MADKTSLELSAYYQNGMREMRDDLMKKLRQAMSRYERMEKMHHPLKVAQGRYIDLLKELIERVKKELP